MNVHQQNAVKAMAAQTRGQIIMPTGVGKTWVQIYSILETLLNTESGLAVMAAHRILLCEQLIKQLLQRTFEFGLEGKFDVLTIASDGIERDDVSELNIDAFDFAKNCNVTRTTTTQEIQDAVKKSRKLKRHLLVVSTYQSVDRLFSIPIDIACFDEAHEVTENDKHENVETILNQCKKVFFFTATPIHDCNGRGMDDTKFYGEKLVQISPKAAIDTANILPPIIHTIRIEDGKPTDHNVIQAAFKAHREKVLEHSNGKIGPKLLVSSAGCEDMVNLVKNHYFHKWALKNGFQVIAFSSGLGYYVNGVDSDRQEAFKVLQSLKDEDSAIIMHYDILTEGIDLPNITGILPLRELNKVKFLQTAGRAARIFRGDRETLLKDIKKRTFIDKDGKVCASKALAKPVFWIIQSPLLNDKALETNQNLVDIVRESYEVEPMFRDIPPTSTTSTPEEADDVLEPIYRTEREAKHAEFIHEFESMVFAEMAPDIQMDCIDVQLDLVESGSIELEIQEVNEEPKTDEEIIEDIDKMLDMIEGEK